MLNRRNAHMVLAVAMMVAAAAIGFAISRLALTSPPAGARADALLACKEAMSGFQRFPLVYAGDEVLGHPLSGCQKSETAPLLDQSGTVALPSAEQFNIAYGDCEIPPNAESCPVPVTIVIDPPRGPTLPASRVRERVLLRGVEVMVKVDGSARLELPSMSVSVFTFGNDYAERRANALAVFASLKGANDAARQLAADSPLSLLQSPECC